MTNEPSETVKAERVAEVRRVLGIFVRGCGNTIGLDGNSEPETCECCTTDVYQRIENIMAGKPHDAHEPSSSAFGDSESPS